MVAALLAAGAFVACAPARTGSTTVTAAAVASPEQPEPREAASRIPATSEIADAAEAPSADPSPPGELACRTKDPFGVVTELFVDGTNAYLRTVAPSGNIALQKLHAVRRDATIIADDPNETDLVVHAAVVHKEGGKTYLRLGDYRQPWSTCQ